MTTDATCVRGGLTCARSPLNLCVLEYFLDIISAIYKDFAPPRHMPVEVWIRPFLSTTTFVLASPSYPNNIDVAQLNGALPDLKCRCCECAGEGALAGRLLDACRHAVTLVGPRSVSAFVSSFSLGSPYLSLIDVRNRLSGPQ